jgi:hypothetical protein
MSSLGKLLRTSCTLTYGKIARFHLVISPIYVCLRATVIQDVYGRQTQLTCLFPMSLWITSIEPQVSCHNPSPHCWSCWPSPRHYDPERIRRGCSCKIMTKLPRAWFWHGNATYVVRTLDSLVPLTVFVRSTETVKTQSIQIRNLIDSWMQDWLFGRWFHLGLLEHTFQKHLADDSE